jgi:SAM-dependent MidA family methyltransferase
MHDNRTVGRAPGTVDPRPSTWRRAWHDALYGPSGFYRLTSPAEHFTTSAQGVPGGGELLAAAVVALARRHGCTRVVDVGAGGGELLAAVRGLAPGLRLTGVDVVDRDPGGVDDWLVSPGGAGLPDALVGLTDTLVVAHEWLDVVPCPVVRRDEDGVWREVCVQPDGTETGGEAVAGEALAWLGRWVPEEVERAEVGLPRDRAAADLLSRVESGALLLVDYGHVRATRPRHGSLTAFRSGREVRLVPDGSCDITAHVAVDSLVDHVRMLHRAEQPDVVPQRVALADLLPDADARVPHELARREPPAYLQALARRAALRTLTAPGGLGDFAWITVRVPRGRHDRQ